MKVLTLNFLTCAVKSCKSSSDSFPLHPKEAELVKDEVEINPQLLVNVLPRIDWRALRTTSTEVGTFSHINWFCSVQRIARRRRAVLSSVAGEGDLILSHLTLHRQLMLESFWAGTGNLLTYACIIKLGFPELPELPPSGDDLTSDDKMLRELHTLLMETQIMEGKLVCGHCGHEYAIREGIANFLLPSHLV